MPTGVFAGASSLSVEAGVSRLHDQRASLAGTSGTLTELGIFAVAWRTGRVALEFAGTARRTDNRTGLDRDVTDFFVTLGASGSRGPLSVGAEAGLGIHGTREPRYEQDDLLLYAARAEWRAGAWTPSVMAVGQWYGTKHPDIRSVEDLGEVRLGLRYGRQRWIRVEGVRGHTPFAPSSGIRFTAGVVR